MAIVTRSGYLLVSLANGLSRSREIFNTVPKSVLPSEFTDKDLEHILRVLGQVIGRAIQSHAPLQRQEWAPHGPIDAKKLHFKLQKASEACELLLDLINLKEGPQCVTPVDSEARYRILSCLRKKPKKLRGARPPARFSVARDQGIKFLKGVELIMQGVAQLKKASDKAKSELSKTKFPTGRPKNTWYVGFTDLLMAICKAQEVTPTLGRSGRPAGKLFFLAKAMEKLLPKELQSTSDEALFDRLKIAKKIIAKRGKT